MIRAFLAFFTTPREHVPGLGFVSLPGALTPSCQAQPHNLAADNLPERLPILSQAYSSCTGDRSLPIAGAFARPLASHAAARREGETRIHGGVNDE